MTKTHLFLCHPDCSACEPGCARQPDPKRQALLDRVWEVGHLVAWLAERSSSESGPTGHLGIETGTFVGQSEDRLTLRVRPDDGGDDTDVSLAWVVDHECDADCQMFIADNECRACGAFHGAPCLGCGGRGYHVTDACPCMACDQAENPEADCVTCTHNQERA